MSNNNGKIFVTKKRKKNEKNSANGRQLATFLFKFDKMNYVQIDIGI